MITLDISKTKGEIKVPRTRKVYYRYYDSESKHPHPMIRLEGFYLEEKGFKVGDKIAVELQFGCIIITKIPAKEESIPSNKQKRLSQK